MQINTNVFFRKYGLEYLCRKQLKPVITNTDAKKEEKRIDVPSRG